MPTLNKLRIQLNEDARASAYLHLLEEGLKSITASMPDQLTTFFEHLTPSEKDIAMMIMSGQTTKGIACIMSREPSTIEFHRNNIRKKLGLNKSGQNLRSKLLSIQ
jgi:DNA-binding NarL/FixJ family response regulator